MTDSTIPIVNPISPTPDPTPWWAKFSLQVGIPTVAAGALGWVLIQNYNVELRTMSESSRRAIVMLEEHAKASQNQLESIAAYQKDANRILLASCLNEAKNDTARDRCHGFIPLPSR